MRTRLPEYLKRPIIDTEKTREVRKILKVNCLNTVCENARCPNKNECYTKHTATFLIMGNNCTRNCRYCNITCAKPEPLDNEEPKHIAQAVKALNLKYAVITSVTRDDLDDGGAEHFANCIYEIKKLCPETKIEILTPDFKNNKNSLDVLKYIKENSDIKTKSGLMIGLGETFEQIKSTMKDLNEVGCDILTVGQYIQPSKEHLEVSKYYTLEEYEILKQMAKESGFKNYQIGPLVRSSYNASGLIK